MRGRVAKEEEWRATSVMMRVTTVANGMEKRFEPPGHCRSNGCRVGNGRGGEEEGGG